MMRIQQDYGSLFIGNGDVRAYLEKSVGAAGERADSAAILGDNLVDDRQGEDVADGEAWGMSLMSLQRGQGLAPVTNSFLTDIKKRSELSLRIAHELIPPDVQINMPSGAGQSVVHNGLFG